MNLFDDLPEVCRRDVPLAPLTWFKLGGRADYLIEPRDEQQLARVILRCREGGVPLRFLGLGANVLVSDEGVRGVVVRLTAEPFTRVEFEGHRVTAGAGADMTRLVRATVRRALAGLETIAGIPGTVGGGIAMNCGGRYGEIGTAVERVRVIGPDGEIYERDHDDLDFGYRHSALGADVVLSATFRLQPADPAELDRRFREIWMYKQNTQPPLGVQSVGCIFRNPNGRSAGELIDRAGLKGLRVGSAWVADRHANFILAEPGGKAADVVELIEAITRRVEEHSGIRLEPEVRIW
jgi:UDP-N-acetylmuramate dehydrogenase